jgi:hypothetical protein
MTKGFTVGDKGTTLVGFMTDGLDPVTRKPKPFDLSGYTVKINFRLPDATTMTRTADIDPDTAAMGMWSYTWAVGELTLPGDWTVESQGESPDGRLTETFGPQTFPVRRQIA